MKTNFAILLMSAITITAILTAPLPCRAAEEAKENIWSEDPPRGHQRRFELTDETIERIMKRLGQTDPKKAQQLEQLRDKDLEKFKVELRKVMREQFGRGRGGKRGSRSRRELRSEHDRPMGGPHGFPGRRGPERMKHQRMRQKHTEYLEWLEKNYPDKAKKLAELKENNPNLYGRKIALSLKKYGRIKEASEENPQLAEVLKEDLELKQKRYRLLGKIRRASDEDQKQQLTKELEQIISSRFDLIVKRKQIAYEQLRQKLEKLKDQVKKSEAELEKQKNVKFKNESVKARLEELISRTEKFKWD